MHRGLENRNARLQYAVKAYWRDTESEAKAARVRREAARLCRAIEASRMPNAWRISRITAGVMTA